MAGFGVTTEALRAWVPPFGPEEERPGQLPRDGVTLFRNAIFALLGTRLSCVSNLRIHVSSRGSATIQLGQNRNA
jgi:hypothetical protein